MKKKKKKFYHYFNILLLLIGIIFLVLLYFTNVLNLIYFGLVTVVLFILTLFIIANINHKHYPFLRMISL